MMSKIFVYGEEKGSISARVYFWINNNFEKILGEEFSFKFVDENTSLPIKAPSSFDPNRFLKFVSDGITILPLEYNDGKELVGIMTTIKNEDEKRYFKIIYEAYKTLYDIKEKGIKLCPKE